MARVKSLVIWFWRIVSRPSAYLSLGFLDARRFRRRRAFLGRLQHRARAHEHEKFCISCHEMHDNVYQELQRTVHFTNRSGVRATCPDCHVPHEWTDKIARKMQASKEVWGKIFGTIYTPRISRHAPGARQARMGAAEGQRLARMPQLPLLDRDGLHQADAPRRRNPWHAISLPGERTCIDCHKGIAHELPDMTGIEPGWRPPPEMRGDDLRGTTTGRRCEAISLTRGHRSTSQMSALSGGFNRSNHMARSASLRDATASSRRSAASVAVPPAAIANVTRP